MRECHGFPASLDDRRLQSQLMNLLSLSNGDTPSVPRLDEVLDDEKIAAIPQDVDRGLRLLSAVHSKRPIVIVRDGELEIDADSGTPILPKELADRIVIITCQELSVLQTAPADTHIVISDGNDLKGWCTASWIRQHPQRVGELTSPAEKTATDPAGYDDEEEEEDLD